MKILAAIIPLLLLVAVRAGDPDPSYPDTCGYTSEAMCGDQCYYDGSSSSCYCGSDTIRPYFDDKHCCGEYCTLDRHNGDCRNGMNEGRTLPKSSPCNTTIGVRCYNSYQHSRVLFDKSHYTCPDTCVPWEAMCRGVSHCEGDHQVCGPNLRCPTWYRDSGNYNVTINNISSSLVPGHHYCLGDSKINDGKFDTIDRSDENTTVRATKSPLDLDISSFTRCNNTDTMIPG